MLRVCRFGGEDAAVPAGEDASAPEADAVVFA